MGWMMAGRKQEESFSFCKRVIEMPHVTANVLYVRETGRTNRKEKMVQSS